MRIQTDGRSQEIDLEQEPELQLEELGETLRPLRVQVAKVVRDVDASGRASLYGFARIEQLARRYGFGGHETRRYLRVGQAMRDIPELEQRLLDGRISFESAEMLGKLLKVPELRWELTPGEEPDEARDRVRHEWLLKAEQLSSREFRHLAAKREAEARKGRRHVLLRALVTPDAQQEIERARVLVSRKKRRPCSTGEAITVTVRHWLDTFDELRREQVHRKQAKVKAAANGKPEAQGAKAPCDVELEPETSANPLSRHIPAPVKLRIRQRAGDCCEFPGCRNDIFLQFAHIIPHANGGSRSAHNLLLLCTRHHFMLDSGTMRFIEWGKYGPVFEDSFGDRFAASERSEEYG